MGKIGESVKSRAQKGLEPVAHSLLADAQVPGDLGHAPARMAEPDHLQTVAGARLHRGLVGAALQFLLLGVGQPYSIHLWLPPPFPFGTLTPPTCLDSFIG